jgi:hypothetical protein
MNDPIVDYRGHTNAGYGAIDNVDFFARNHIMAGSHIQGEPRLALVQLDNIKYSDELANGDESDDKEIHEEEDMNDPVVDYNGHTNAGYGAITNKEFFDRNHIMPGSHIQGEPRTKSLLQYDVVTRWLTENGPMENKPFFEQNHILPGHHIQGEPRTPQSLMQYDVVTRWLTENGPMENKPFFEQNHILPGHHIQGEPRTPAALIQMYGMTPLF